MIMIIKYHKNNTNRRVYNSKLYNCLASLTVGRSLLENYWTSDVPVCSLSTAWADPPEDSTSLNQSSFIWEMSETGTCRNFYSRGESRGDGYLVVAVNQQPTSKRREKFEYHAPPTNNNYQSLLLQSVD